MDKLKRNANLRKNIFSIGFFKVINIVLTFLLVPLTIHYLGPEKYGLWVTLLSVFSWIAFIEIGIGNGLRNKLTESLSEKSFDLARVYVSTAYLVLFIITLFVLSAVWLVVPFFDLQILFNVQQIPQKTLQYLSIILISFIGINLTLSLFKSIAFSLQKAAAEASSQALFLCITALGLVWLIWNNFDDIVLLAILHVIALIVTSLIFSYWVFKKAPELIPRLKHANLRQAKPMLNLGFGFFVIQVSGVVIFSTDNIIITHLLSPAHVTTYSVVMKLFMAFNLLQVVVQTPLWSAYTDAYKRGELVWIKKTLRNMVLLMFPFVGLIVFVAYHARFLIAVWVRETLIIPDLLIWTVAAYTVLLLWNNIFGYLLNGIGKIRLSSIVFTGAAIFNIPLSIYFAKTLGLGMAGVALGTICSILPNSLIGPVQVIYFLFIQKKKKYLDVLLS